MKKLIIIVLALVSAFSSNVFAGSNNGRHKILHINLHDSGHILIKLDGSSNTEDCYDDKYKNYILLDKNYAHYERMYSMALAAYSQNKPIKSWVSGCKDLWGSGNSRMVIATTMVIGE